MYVRELAFRSAVNLIANSVSKCEFKTFLRGEETQGPEYYLWNVQPNRNQNSSEFIHKWVSKLYERNEALIVEVDGNLLVADSFNKQEFALYDHVFSGVTVNELTFARPFYMNQVLYFQLSDNNVRALVNGLYESYGKLTAYSMKSFQRSRGSRGILKIDAQTSAKPGYKADLENLMNERFKKFFEADNAVVPLTTGYKYDDIGSKTYSPETTRDIRAQVDDIFDFTARALGIPPALLRGDLANVSDAVNNLLTFCVDPLCDMMQEEINRKRNGLSGFLQKTYLQIDTRNIKHLDLLSMAGSIDKLLSSGVYSVNGIRRLLGESTINEPWADQHFMTKNYTTVEELLEAMNQLVAEKGGNGAQNNLGTQTGS